MRDNRAIFHSNQFSRFQDIRFELKYIVWKKKDSTKSTSNDFVNFFFLFSDENIPKG